MSKKCRKKWETNLPQFIFDTFFNIERRKRIVFPSFSFSKKSIFAILRKTTDSEKHLLVLAHLRYFIISNDNIEASNRKLMGIITVFKLLNKFIDFMCYGLHNLVRNYFRWNIVVCIQIREKIGTDDWSSIISGIGRKKLMEICDRMRFNVSEILKIL